MPDLRIRDCPLEDMAALSVHELYKLRVDVFVHEQRCPYQEIDEHDAHPSTRHILVRDPATNQLIGCARMYPDELNKEPIVMVGRIITHPSHRGHGHAAAMIRYTLSRAAELYPKRTVHIHAQSRLEGFYESFGFEVCGPRFHEEGIEHTPMRQRPIDAP